jgi:Fe-S-cluster containining protein
MFKMPPIPVPPEIEGLAGARRRLAQLLMALRSPDPPGAFAALAEDRALIDELVQWTGREQDELWQRLVDRVEELAKAQRCLRCGTCCRASSPTLYVDDLERITTGKLPRSSLYALRRGEVVHCQREQERQVLDQDLIKLRERPQGGCLLLDDHLCRDYDHRPLQCRHLECWSGQHAGQLEDHLRLTRQQVYADDERALQLIEEYEAKLPLPALMNALDAAVQGDEEGAAGALAFIELDHRLRAGVESTYGYGLGEQELLFGRDALAVVRGLGLVINVEDDDRPVFASRRREEEGSCASCQGKCDQAR